MTTSSVPAGPPSPPAAEPLPPAPGFWNAVAGIARRRELAELLDGAAVNPHHLHGNLRDLRLMNRWLLWSRSVLREVGPLLPATKTALVLDIATGSADIPLAMLARAGKDGRMLRAIAGDISAPVLMAARRHDRGRQLHFVRHDGLALPFRDASVDVATCCLAAHHFAPDALVQVLAELWRVASRGIVISDLYRSRHGYLAARAMALILRNPLTSHDGPVSVLRAYTPAELTSLAVAAGISGARVRRSFPVRMTLVARKE